MFQRMLYLMWDDGEIIHDYKPVSAKQKWYMATYFLLSIGSIIFVAPAIIYNWIPYWGILIIAGLSIPIVLWAYDKLYEDIPNPKILKEKLQDGKVKNPIYIKDLSTNKTVYGEYRVDYEQLIVLGEEKLEILSLPLNEYDTKWIAYSDNPDIEYN